MAFATQPVVTEEDAFGNVITSGQHAHGDGGARQHRARPALQGSTLTVTLSSGVATFSGLSYNKAETMNILFTTNAAA